MEKVFVDTNIILDWLAKREPFFIHAKSLFQLAENKEIELLISTMSYITTEYILRKQLGKEQTIKVLIGVRNITSVCTSGTEEIDLSLTADRKDFEDSFQYFTALNNDAAVIITRNPKDFKNSRLPVLSAEQYIKLRK